MTSRRAVVVLSFLAVLAAQLAFASSSPAARPRHHPQVLNSVPDSWLGGFGVWSNPDHWSDGIPGLNSDVSIVTGDDLVWLDVNSNLASLSLGGASGNSTLDGTLGQSLNVFGDVNVGEAGSFYLANGASFTSHDIYNRGNISLFTPRDRISAQSLTNYASGFFNLDFARGNIGQIKNYGVVDIHDGQATLDVADFSNRSITNVVMRGQLNVAGTLSNSSGATLNINGPNSGATTNILINYGAIAQNGGSMTASTLINGGSIQADRFSRIEIGTGKSSGTGYYQHSDGIFAEIIGVGYFGVLTLDGPAMLDGDLNIVLDNGFIPLVGSMYRFLNFTPGTLSGSFARIQDPYFDGGHEMWEIQYDNANGFAQLVAVPTPEPGSMLLLAGGLLAMGRLRRYFV
jgi:hypothetical protein